MVKCVDCENKQFAKGNGSPGRYYCTHPDARFARSECEPTPMICRTGRHDNIMIVKTAPRWCPRNKK